MADYGSSSVSTKSLERQLLDLADQQNAEDPRVDGRRLG